MTAPGGPRDKAEQLHAADMQVYRAHEALRADYSAAPRLPWDAVHELTGPMLPSTWWVLAAHTGRGKTTLAMNILSALARQGRRVTMLALEQSQETMRATWAAVSLGYRTSYVLEHRWAELPPGAEAAVHAHMDEMQFLGAHDRVKFADERFLDPETLPRIIEREAREGAELVMIDHLHRIAEPSYRGVSLAAKALTEAARATGVPILCTAQMGMGPERDPLRPFLACQLEDIYGSGVVAQECWVALGLYWPLRETGKEVLAAVRRREVEAHTLAEPNTLALRIMKHRVRGGEVVGHVRTLRYEHGRIIDPTMNDAAPIERGDAYEEAQR
jgi:replicative DNA helicase